MTEAPPRSGRKWSIAAVMFYGAIAVTAPGSWGGTLALTPLPMILTAVAWRRDRASRVRRVAMWMTFVLLVLSLLILIFHLLWGDLS